MAAKEIEKKGETPEKAEKNKTSAKAVKKTPAAKKTVKRAASGSSARKTGVKKNVKDFEGKTLVVVESPAKAKTLEKILGKDYKVLASVGHVRDLPKGRIAIDIDNDFEPDYIQVRGKADVVRSLKNASGASAATLLDRKSVV